MWWLDPQFGVFANYASGDRRGTGMSLFSFGGNIGFALGPILITPAVLLFGLSGTLVVAIVPLFVAVVLAFELPKLKARSAELQKLGFEIEAFGPTTIKVSAIPAMLTTEDASRALRALGEDLEGIDRGAQVQEALQRIAATTACHAAVKANHPLSYEKMAHILDELRQTAYSSVCPHGRPVMLRLTRREVEKNFQRI